MKHAQNHAQGSRLKARGSRQKISAFSLQPRAFSHAFTLIELLIGAATLAIAIVALLGAFFGQITLNEHARNMTWAINDANRVMERLRQVNSGCTTPSTATDATDVTKVPAAECGGVACTSWDNWLENQRPTAGVSGKSIQPDPVNNELILVRTKPGTTDPLEITVAVCWRHRGRILGECIANGTALQASDTGVNGFTAGDGIIGSPAMLTTLMTCRS